MNKSIVIIFLVLTSSFSKAQLYNEKWTPEYQMNFKNIISTNISPDGKYVAYVVREAVIDGEQSEYLTQVWVASTDGNFNEQYTRGKISSYAPQFSPYGTEIAFISSVEDKPQIFKTGLTDGKTTQVTFAKNGVDQFKWAPDGNSIYFIQAEPLTGDEGKQKKEKQKFSVVAKNLKYTHLYNVDLKAKNKVKQLTNSDYSISSFSISPDGEKIAFSFGYDSTVNTDYFDSDIGLMSVDSGEVKVVVRRTGIDRNPVFSPDGNYLAFETTNGKTEPNGLSDLSLIDLNNFNISVLPKTPNRNASIIEWDPSGTRLYFQEVVRTSGSALVMDITNNYRNSKKTIQVTSKTIHVTGKTMITDPTGTSGAFDFSQNGMMSYVFQNPETPQEVYVQDLKTDGVLQISHINDDKFLPDMGKTEIIKWKSRDGREIEGLLTYPIGYRPGQRCPIILNVHGGAAGVFTNSFTGGASIYMVQSFAENGYAVLRPNPRGSTGYGLDFRYVSFKDWGYDLVSGMDKVIEMGVGDPDNQFMMSWSSGGLMTSFAVTKTDRFNAASMGAGMPNLIKMVSTDEIQEALSEKMGVGFWSNFEMSEKESLVVSIKNVKTPTQVIHGQNDISAPTVQGQDYFVALKINGVDTEMILYPEIADNPQDMKVLMDVSGRIMMWFDKYKK
ncbi:MAG: S9 family peptidase [Cyclobacteriaceae bacterium]|nr:S9 family peptidase [Cyclobacteriaceae bacterium]